MSQAASPISQADIMARPSLYLWALRRELVEPGGTGLGEAALRAGPAQGAEARHGDSQCWSASASLSPFPLSLPPWPVVRFPEAIGTEHGEPPEDG